VGGGLTAGEADDGFCQIDGFFEGTELNQSIDKIASLVLAQLTSEPFADMRSKRFLCLPLCLDGLK
jgi:hypothetical protein